MDHTASPPDTAANSPNPPARKPAMRSILGSSLRRTARHWPVLLVLWLAALLTALPFALLPGEALLSLAGRPVIAAMADGIDSWQWVDLFSVVQSGSTGGPAAQPGLFSDETGQSNPFPAEFQQAMIGFLLAAALLLPLGGLVSAFCYGGLLLSLRPVLPAAGQPPGHRQPAASPTRVGPEEPAGEQTGELSQATSDARPEPAVEVPDSQHPTAPAARPEPAGEQPAPGQPPAPVEPAPNAGWLPPLPPASAGSTRSAWSLRSLAAAPDQAPPGSRQAAGSLPPASTLGRFMWGGWRWMSTFVVLAALQFLATLLLVGPLLAFGASLALRPGAWGLLLLPMAALAAAWLALFEQARVWCVLNGSRSPFRALGRVFMALARRPLGWTAFYGLNLLALLGLHALFRLVILPAAAPFWPLALLAQQVFIITRLFFRVARLAGGMEILANE